jgi:hypothetical protein
LGAVPANVAFQSLAMADWLVSRTTVHVETALDPELLTVRLSQ